MRGVTGGLASRACIDKDFYAFKLNIKSITVEQAIEAVPA
jgi:hypothetical protein